MCNRNTLLLHVSNCIFLRIHLWMVHILSYLLDLFQANFCFSPTLIYCMSIYSMYAFKIFVFIYIIVSC